jgi:hypothetical protein
MPSPRLALTLALSLTGLAVLWLTQLPLGVPDEWTWLRITYESGIEGLLGAAQALLTGTLLLAVAVFGAGRVSAGSRIEITGWLLGLMLTGTAWMLAVQEAPPAEYRLSKVPFALYYPAASGYFHRARYDIDDTREFLAGYEALMQEGDVLHTGTHPPGLFLLFRGLIRVVESSPGLVAALERTQPQSVMDAFESVRLSIRLSGKELTRADEAVIWLTALLTQVLAAGAVLPLFALLSGYVDRSVAWRIVCLWPLIPALAVFAPIADVLFVCPVTLFLWCWDRAVCHRSIVLGGLAGALGLLGLTLSLVFLPIGLIALLMSIFDRADVGVESGRAALKRNLRSLLRPAAGGLTVIVAGLLLSDQWLQLDLLTVWRLNVRNHAGFYDQYPRTWWKWLLVNPVELASALGWPAAVCVVASLPAGLRSRQRSRVLAVLTVWGFLWLSGKNSGEAARLWIPLLPLCLILLAAGLHQVATDPEEPQARRSWIILLILQALTCLLTVMRVTGFHFSELPVPQT